MNRNNIKDVCIPPIGLPNSSKQNGIKKKKNLNLYNTCYINSSIQCLLRLEGFISGILNCCNGKILKATKKLIYNMIKKDKNLSVLGIKKAMGEFDSKYNDNNPEDANEFISDYLNALHKETGIKDKNLINEIGQDENYTNFLKKIYKKGTSFITKLFFGILKTNKFCSNKCNETFSVKYSSFSILDLPLYYPEINKKQTLEIKDIIERYVRKKEISGMTCKQCGKNLYVKTDIYKFPNNLIIYLEREDDDYYIENDINIKETIDLTNFLPKEKTEKACYNLKGVIYYSFLSNNVSHYSSSCLIGNKWYYFDDDNYESNKEYNEYEGDNPILLFYEKNN